MCKAETATLEVSALADRSRNAAHTNASSAISNININVNALGPRYRRAMTVRFLPPSRRAICVATKSCTAPRNTPPIKIQNNAGPHPYKRANTGPTIGPAPAIEAK